MAKRGVWVSQGNLDSRWGTYWIFHGMLGMPTYPTLQCPGQQRPLGRVCGCMAVPGGQLLLCPSYAAHSSVMPCSLLLCTRVLCSAGVMREWQGRVTWCMAGPTDLVFHHNGHRPPWLSPPLHWAHCTALHCTTLHLHSTGAVSNVSSCHTVTQPR